MNADLFTPRESDASTPTSTPMSVLVIYENAQARMWTEGVYGHLTQELAADFDFESMWCGFEDLQDSHFAYKATAAAKDANLIFFSVRADAEPSALVKSWVETWVATKDSQESALIVLIDRSAGHKRKGLPFKTYLAGIARRTGMDFLSHVLTLPAAVSMASASEDLGRSRLAAPAYSPLPVPAFPSAALSQSGPLSESWPV
jgi:hypothetical protein